jgi:putative hemolysin
MSRKLFILSIILVILMTGCIKKTNNNTSLPNPASQFCEDNGGKLEIRTAADGSQSGVCVFPDGSECDEWDYFHSECQPGDSLQEGNSALANPASVYCQENDGKLEIRTADDGSQSGVCVFSDGSECEEWAYLSGVCHPGDVFPNTTNPANPKDATGLNAGILPVIAIDQVYCEELGGNFDVRPVDDDGWSANCLLPEKSNCSALAFSRGECEIGGPYMEDQLN